MWPLLGLVLAFQLPHKIGSCASTADSTVTTTASTVTTSTVSTDSTTSSTSTTTTAITTTTTIVTGCAGCTLDNPPIAHVMLNLGAVDIDTDTVGVNNAGCATRTITCDGNGGGSTVFISWNDDAAGTTQGVDMANFVTGTVTCEADMQWHLTPGGPPITTAECDAT